MENFRLRVFRAVAAHLNFRIAAEELLLTQPAVTSQIKALEAELGAALFSRTGGRVSLTPAGLALLPFAERLRALAAEARHAVAEAAGTRSGALALGASQTIGQYLLPRLIAGFLETAPETTLNLFSGNTQQVLEELRARRIDLALIEGPALGTDLRVTPFMQDHLVCLVPPDHPWADREITLDELRKGTLLSREQGSGSRRILESALEAAGVKVRELHARIVFDSTEALLSAVEAGLGIAFCSRWAVRNQLALGTLRLARVRGLELARMFSVAVPAGPEPAGLPGAFARFVHERGERNVPRATGRARNPTGERPGSNSDPIPVNRRE
jgi:DNA-binding transcriptional LysR family regulator